MSKNTENKKTGILNFVKGQFRRVGKSERTSGDKFAVKIVNTKKGVSETFEYHDNYYNERSLNSVLYSILLDKRVGEDCDDEFEVARELGYDLNTRDGYKEAQRVLKGCKKNAQKVNRLFDKPELEQLEKEFENY